MCIKYQSNTSNLKIEWLHHLNPVSTSNQSFTSFIYHSSHSTSPAFKSWYRCTISLMASSSDMWILSRWVSMCSGASSTSPGPGYQWVKLRVAPPKPKNHGESKLFEEQLGPRYLQKVGDLQTHCTHCFPTMDHRMRFNMI